MQAIVQHRYGGPEVLEAREVPRPVPGPGEVLVRVAATTLQPLDWHFMRGEPFPIRALSGLRRPTKRTVLGSDLAGTVESLGDGVTDLAPGDEVFGVSPGGGGLAEFVAVRREHLRRKPERLSMVEAGAVGVAAITALQAVRDHGRAVAGERVLVVGASGGVGTYAIQIAKAAGGHVTAVCSGRNAELVRSIGADEVVDYTRQHWAQLGQTWDLIVQIAGTDPLRDVLACLTAGGRFVLVGSNDDGKLLGPGVRALRTLLRKPFSKAELTTFTAVETASDLEALAEMIDAGDVTPVIDRTFALVHAAEAMAYVESFRARGKVVVTPSAP